jgi:hypothetical protein
MFHPLIADLTDLSSQELETKINELSRKYFIAARSGNADLGQQIIVALEMYKEQLRAKNLAASKVATQSGNKDLDDLIKIT